MPGFAFFVFVFFVFVFFVIYFMWAIMQQLVYPSRSRNLGRSDRLGRLPQEQAIEVVSDVVSHSAAGVEGMRPGAAEHTWEGAGSMVTRGIV